RSKSRQNRCAAPAPAAKCREYVCGSAGSAHVRRPRQRSSAWSCRASKTSPKSTATTSRPVKPLPVGSQGPGGCSKRLLDDGPVVIASIAGLLKQPDPAVRVVVELGGQDPLLEPLLLLRRPVGIDLNEPLPRCQALDFTQARDQLIPLEVVDRIQRND